MNIKITRFTKRESKVNLYKDIRRLRRFKSAGQVYLQFIEKGEYVRVYLNKGDKYEVVE